MEVQDNNLTEVEKQFSLFNVSDDKEKFRGVKIFAAEISGIHTDFVIRNYSNRLFIIITQHKKIGTLLNIKKTILEDANREIFEVVPLFGVENGEYNLVGRYLMEQLSISKPLLLGISLKDTKIETIQHLHTILKENQIW